MSFSKFELVKYFLLQNRHVWSGLTKKQKKIIFNANVLHNNIREDYKNPELYQKGLNYNSSVDRGSLYRGKVVEDILGRYNFESILEIGPGAGFITKTLLGTEPLRYTAVDIVKPFLEYCQKAIANDKSVVTKCDFLHKNISRIPASEKYDVIVFLSSLHHIPDREEFMNTLIKFCHSKTVIISVEPTHYIQRILRNIKNLKKFLNKDFINYNNYENLSTHSFLTLNEFKSFKKFEILEYGFEYSKNLPFKFGRYFSNEMYVLLKPTEAID